MAKLVRFGVSLDEQLLKRFDKRIQRKRYTNRSEAIRDLIRQELVMEQWQQDGQSVAAAITMVYDHHQRGLVGDLMEIQHDYHDLILSSQHIHLDHNHCLEVIVTKGSPSRLEELHSRLQAQRGVFHVGLSITTANP
ncbi:nickel-responsive transcriptional regulator NikR [Desulfurispira natronophila]|uniref:Putative nickel-responsive regulator n=1 Tax=Desulfurispira natronophila TaxID=682562 RepID=A0A7W7Y2C2_9BACT|nr:nickel-responsive transcriptional regulator NikR [Desulfurispira natronophila]MBB5020734.1 CopG family nickel-responsive transcriptional regulator [Desulfurispira natronophila]